MSKDDEFTQHSISDMVIELTNLRAENERLKAEVKVAEDDCNTQYDKGTDQEIENTRIEKLVAQALGELSRIDRGGISIRDDERVSDAESFLGNV